MGVVKFVLRAPGRAPRYRVTLEHLTLHTAIARECIAMGRWSDKLKKVTDVVQALDESIDRDVEDFVTRAGEIDAKRSQVKATGMSRLDARMTDLAGLEQDLNELDAVLGNGAPGGSSAGAKPSTATAPVGMQAPAPHPPSPYDGTQPNPPANAWTSPDGAADAAKQAIDSVVKS